MLSRVQELNQLFIIGRLPENKFYASPRALEELARLNTISVNKNPPIWEQTYDWSIKISVLNIRSIMKHFDDLKEDSVLMYSDVICLTETWLKIDSAVDQLNMCGYQLHTNSARDGKGIMIYYKIDTVSPVISITKLKYQISMLKSSDIDIIAVYRSQGAEDLDIARDIENILEHQKMTIICGDFNICYQEQRKNVIFNKLDDFGFLQLVREATHLKGGNIDQVWSNHNHRTVKVDVALYSPYYVCDDHDAICTTVRKAQS